MRARLLAIWTWLSATFQDLKRIARDLKWIIAVCLVVCAIIYYPDQVRELYRVAATEGGRVAAAQFIALLLVALFIWIGAQQVTTQTLNEGSPTRRSQVVAQVVVALLTGLPLLLAAIAQQKAKPTYPAITPEKLKSLHEVGSVYRVQAENLEAGTATLNWFFWILLVTAVAVAVMAYLASGRFRALSDSANKRYFSSPVTLLYTVAFTIVVTTIFVLAPVGLPQALSPFGILAAFTLCVMAFCVHLSLLTIRHGFPYLPVLLLWGLLLSAWDWNDNHTVRQATADQKKAEPPRTAAGNAFVGWLKHQHAQHGKRTRTTGGDPEFPVFIVSAQGGGIYAAYNTAIFLARIQDRCPAFRDHLFAISSVSGGSIGAATFVTALHASDRRPSPAPRPQQIASSGPCPDIAAFLSRARAMDLDRAGAIEESVDNALSTDFLSPLAAAALFPNFAQFFIPRPFGWLDRARALEYTLEHAAGAMYPPARSADNLMKASFREHWQPQDSLPALLMNATGSGSGKRVVISPFDLSRPDPINTDVCVLTNTGSAKPPPGSLNLPLSTAAFVSARFPWITPAATVDVENPCITKKDRVRLVDGGYIDNSGVETALNLIEEIAAAADRARKANPGDIPPIRIYLFSLTGGDFPDRGEFSFNELVEPVRALLSGRESRAYIALNRAALQLRAAATPGQSTLPSFNRSNLDGHFYNLPLGWAISERTREIIALGSGRYMDCKPKDDFSQTRPHLANADCINMQIYHALNRYLLVDEVEHVEAKNGVAIAAAALKAEKDAKPRIDHERLLVCYDRWWHLHTKQRWEAAKAAWQKDTRKDKAREFPAYREQHLSYYQSDQVRDLLREWDRSPQFDQNMLAYLLGSVSYDSADFRRSSENLSFGTEREIQRYWGNRVQQINKIRKSSDPNASDVDLRAFINNPKALAGLVWGWPKNWFGNKDEDDAWRYRTRGVYQLVGRWDYDQATAWLKKSYPALGINLVETPDALTHPVISAKLVYALFASRNYVVKSEKDKKIVTLFGTLRDNPGDWKKARSIQSDKERGSAAISEVAERSAMFQSCISEAAKALQTASP